MNFYILAHWALAVTLWDKHYYNCPILWKVCFLQPLVFAIPPFQVIRWCKKLSTFRSHQFFPSLSSKVTLSFISFLLMKSSRIHSDDQTSMVADITLLPFSHWFHNQPDVLFYPISAIPPRMFSSSFSTVTAIICAIIVLFFFSSLWVTVSFNPFPFHLYLVVEFFLKSKFTT